MTNQAGQNCKGEEHPGRAALKHEQDQRDV